MCFLHLGFEAYLMLQYTLILFYMMFSSNGWDFILQVYPSMNYTVPDHCLLPSSQLVTQLTRHQYLMFWFDCHLFFF